MSKDEFQSCLQASHIKTVLPESGATQLRRHRDPYRSHRHAVYDRNRWQLCVAVEQWSCCKMDTTLIHELLLHEQKQDISVFSLCYFLPSLSVISAIIPVFITMNSLICYCRLNTAVMRFNSYIYTTQTARSSLHYEN